MHHPIYISIPGWIATPLVCNLDYRRKPENVSTPFPTHSRRYPALTGLTRLVAFIYPGLQSGLEYAAPTALVLKRKGINPYSIYDSECRVTMQ